MMGTKLKKPTTTPAQDGYIAALASGADVNLIPEESYWELRALGLVDDGELTEAGLALAKGLAARLIPADLSRLEAMSEAEKAQLADSARANINPNCTIHFASPGKVED